MAGSTQQLDVVLCQGRATIFQFLDMVTKQTGAGSSAPFADIWPFVPNGGQQVPPCRARVKAVSTLGRLLGYAGIQNTDKRLQAAQ